MQNSIVATNKITTEIDNYLLLQMVHLYNIKISLYTLEIKCIQDRKKSAFSSLHYYFKITYMFIRRPSIYLLNWLNDSSLLMCANTGSLVLFSWFFFFPVNEFLTGKPCPYSPSFTIFSTLKCYYICQLEVKEFSYIPLVWDAIFSALAALYSAAERIDCTNTIYAMAWVSFWKSWTH